MYYLAGYVDGEGCFRWNGSTVCAGVTNTYPWVLQVFREMWGGRIRNKQKAKRHHKQAYEWEVSGADAARFAKDIAPFLREKRRQADIVRDLMGFPKGSDQRSEGVSLLAELKRVEYDFNG